MTLILKIMHGWDLSPSDSDNPHSVFGDITSCSFHRRDGALTDGGAYARIYQREPIKTAQVAGFSENERLIDLSGPAYLMNESGKTVSIFAPTWMAPD